MNNENVVEYESDGKVSSYLMAQNYSSLEERVAAHVAEGIEPVVLPVANTGRRPATWLDVITPTTMPSPWTPPDFDPVTRKAINKLGEENSELTTVLFRIQNQTDGLDAIIPGETKTNRQWLEEEIADVMATSALAVKHLKLDLEFIEQRARKKTVYLEKWYMMEPIDPEGHKE